MEGNRGGVARRHQFSKEIREAVRESSRLDNWHGPLETVEHWIVVAVAFAGSWWLWQHAPVAVSVPAYVVAVFLIGGRQRALAGVLHMATHRALMSHTRAGSVIGGLFGGYPVLQSFTGYRASHLGEHHGRLGDPERDPDYQQYQRNGLCGDDLSRRAVRRYLLTMLGPRATLSYVAYLLRHRIVTGGEQLWERWVRGALTAAVLLVGVWGGWLDLLALYWLVPLVTTQVWLGAVAELLEHFPVIETAPRVDIYMSWNRRYPLPLRFLLGEKQGEGYHLVHHLFPRTPLWRLKDVHAVLSRDPEYAALPTLGGVFAAMSTIYRSLPERPEHPERGAPAPAAG
ncbi:fatty acid desaturase family protein [Streptomyces daliensis]|uniref:Fatty acid desaturase n=1 Tax=Streptomyces daliensis TaxID=299421 RepID=A0A8T4IR14_9ACTN|nr:fatty acid desaturase [Streptomyces daliensis]